MAEAEEEIKPTEEKPSGEKPPPKNLFYKKYYQFFLLGLIILIFFLLFAVFVVFYQAYHRPLPSFNAIQSSGQTLELVSYDEPNLLPDTILRWASKAATTAYTFDYVNYISQLNAARPYFTSDGWQSFLQSVQPLIDTIVASQLIVNGVVSGPPVISNQGPLPGRGYVWRVQIPFLVTYQTANNITPRNLFVILTIVRVPTTINPQGIGIDQFVMR